MKHYDAEWHVRGDSEYVDDVAAPAGMLHAAVVGSPVAHGTIRSIDSASALAMPGVVAVITADDIPGKNQLGPIIQDETLLAVDEVHYIGQPTALVVAETVEAARLAASEVDVSCDELDVIVDPRVAHESGHFIDTPRTFSMGDVDAAWAECDHVIEGQCEIAGQEHLYLETQRARAVPTEAERICVYSSTQGPYAVQTAIATVLGVPSHRIEVDVRRLGGGFGGKEDQATPWAVLVALATYLLDVPVQLVLHRLDDMRMTGKRHPYAADFKIGLKSDGTILAYDARLYQNSGAAADLSTAVLERSLFHGTNAYSIPNTRVYAACCRTNLHPHTAFRGFGGPQSMFVIESAIAAAADELKVSREELQYQNLLSEGDLFPYGQQAEECHARRTWEDAVQSFDFADARAGVDAFNAHNETLKRGLAVMPICFGIAFTKTFLNQASALVHIYTDGSVSLSTGGVEMGQGVNSKLIGIAAKAFGISASRIRVESTNTTRIANMSPSAASATTDLNGNATILAANEILTRFRNLLGRELGIHEVDAFEFVEGQVHFRGKPVEGWDWERVVGTAYVNRIGLSAHAFYATPNLNFDVNEEKGRPFAYHVYGTAIVESEIDVLRGTYDIRSVKIVHDLGRPINEIVDIGQVEGGLAQGTGWMTLEELAYGDDGRLLSGALSTYKAPDVYCTPEVELEFLTDESPTGPYGSKAVGEPPLMYGIGAYFSLRDALRAARPDGVFSFDAPMTPERVLMQLYPEVVKEWTAQPRAAE